mmetsp:Transcript_18906/g.33310  ORF Transcript_18906/g.33310 Transcript_18906/m.33310 type:complete len:425 (-) Transcript_18906:79-1353(-)
MVSWKKKIKNHFLFRHKKTKKQSQVPTRIEIEMDCSSPAFISPGGVAVPEESICKMIASRGDPTVECSYDSSASIGWAVAGFHSEEEAISAASPPPEEQQSPLPPPPPPSTPDLSMSTQGSELETKSTLTVAVSPDSAMTDIATYNQCDDVENLPSVLLAVADNSSNGIEEVENPSTKSENAQKCAYGEREHPDAANVYGYEDAAPASDSSSNIYGYECAEPSAAISRSDARMPRRSSLKGSLSHRPRRRASIGACVTMLEVKLPGNQEPVRRRRSISFREDVAVQQVTPAVAMVERPDDLWIQEDELAMNAEKILLLLQSVDTAEVDIDKNGDFSVNGKSYCSRGLEQYFSPELAQMKRLQALQCVMNEQHLQRQVGDYDEETLANIYKYSTLRSQREASLRACRDAEEAESYLHKQSRRASM